MLKAHKMDQRRQRLIKVARRKRKSFNRLYWGPLRLHKVDCLPQLLFKVDYLPRLLLKVDYLPQQLLKE